MNKKAALLPLLLLPAFTFTLVNGFNDVQYHNVYAESEKTIYIDVSLNDTFVIDGADPYIQYGSEIVNLTKMNSVYRTSYQIPTSVFNNGFDICCFGGLTTITVNGENSLKSEHYNYVCIDNDGVKGFGYFGSKTPNPDDATYRTQRVWFYTDENSFFANDDWGSSCEAVVSYYADDTWKFTPMKTTTNTHNSKVYRYVDIPSIVTSVHFLKMSNSEGHNYLIYEDYLQYLTYGVCYQYSSNEVSVTGVLDADANILSRVVEAYLTYGKDDSNGCTTNTVRNLFNTWFKNKYASTDELKFTMIHDYIGYAANGNKYEGLESKDGVFSVNEKWNTMCSQAGIDPKTGEARGVDLFAWLKNTKVLTIVIIGAVVLVGGIIFVIYLVRRKKRNA